MTMLESNSGKLFFLISLSLLILLTPSYVKNSFGQDFGMIVELDAVTYDPYDDVNIVVVAPKSNDYSDYADSIGDSGVLVTIYTDIGLLEKYRLLETGPDTGVFVGKIKLTGPYSKDNGSGPHDGVISTNYFDSIKVKIDNTVTKEVIITEAKIHSFAKELGEVLQSDWGIGIVPESFEYCGDRHCFTQKSITIQKNDRVVFHNSDVVTHQIVVTDENLNSSESDIIQSDDSIEYTFDVVGKYEFHSKDYPKTSVIIFVQAQTSDFYAEQTVPNNNLDFLEKEFQSNLIDYEFYFDSEKTYHSGDTLNITGKLPTSDTNPIIIRIRSNSGAIITVDQITPSTDGSFSKKMKVGGALYPESGKYTVTWNIGDREGSNSFEYSNMASSITSIPSSNLGDSNEKPQSQEKICGPYTILENGKCIIQETVCGSGTVLKDDQCVLENESHSSNNGWIGGLSIILIGVIIYIIYELRQQKSIKKWQSTIIVITVFVIILFAIIAYFSSYTSNETTKENQESTNIIPSNPIVIDKTDEKEEQKINSSENCDDVGTALVDPLFLKPCYNEDKLALLIHEKINEQRSNSNLALLSFDSKLAKIAKSHSQDMMNNDLSHVSSDEKTLGDRYVKSGYFCKIKVSEVTTSEGTVTTFAYGGENIANDGLYDSYTTSIFGRSIIEWKSPEEIADSVVIGNKPDQGWMNSPGHRNNILTSFWNVEGIGVSIDEEGSVYVTQNFC